MHILGMSQGVLGVSMELGTHGLGGRVWFSPFQTSPLPVLQSSMKKVPSEESSGVHWDSKPAVRRQESGQLQGPLLSHLTSPARRPAEGMKEGSGKSMEEPAQACTWSVPYGGVGVRYWATGSRIWDLVLSVTHGWEHSYSLVPRLEAVQGSSA